MSSPTPPTSVSAPLDVPPSSLRSLGLQTAVAAVLAVWRLGERSPQDLPRDLPFLVSLFWILDLHVKRPGIRAWLVPLAVLALFASYVLGHLPVLLSQLRHSL